MTLSLPASAALANGLLIGLIPTVVDGIKPSLKARLDLPEGRLSWFSRLFYLTWILFMPLAGWLADAWPNRDVLLFGGLVPLILGIAWLALARSWTAMLLSVLVIGAAYSTVTTTTIRWMTRAFFPDEVADYPLNIASLNLGFVAVGAGALIGPWVVLLVQRFSGARQGLLYLSIYLLLPAVLAALCDSHAFPPPPEKTATWDDVVMRVELGLLAGIILLYFALENCLEYWPEAYLKDLGYEGGGLQVGLHVFWIAFIGSRAAAAWWLYENANPLHPNYAFAFTLVLFCLSALILGNLASGFDFGGGSIGFWLLGVSYGPLLPGLLGIALDLNGGADAPLPTWAFGLLLALSGLDTLLVRPALGVFATGRAVRYVMRAPAFLALLAAAALLVVPFIR